MQISKCGLITLFISWVLLVAACAPVPSGPSSQTATARYNSALVKIDRPEAAKERYGSVIAIRPEADNKYAYEDGLLTGVFYTTTSRINFILKNKTAHSIKIVWDGAAFIEVDGQAARVVHQGVKYVDRNASQPPSVIPAGSSLTDFAMPSNRVYYRQGYYSRYSSSPGGWEELPLIQPASRQIAIGDFTAMETFASEVQNNKGKRFGLLLPLEIEGVVNEYTFWFEILEASMNP